MAKNSKQSVNQPSLYVHVKLYLQSLFVLQSFLNYLIFIQRETYIYSYHIDFYGDFLKNEVEKRSKIIFLHR
jgi:hypothetical protein